jgi:hypothetical protein
MENVVMEMITTCAQQRAFQSGQQQLPRQNLTFSHLPIPSLAGGGAHAIK